MAKIKIQNLEKEVNRLIDRRFRVAQRNFSVTAAEKTARGIKSRISRGLSPVEGEGPYEKYSESYKKQIRRGNIRGKRSVRPVNLRVTGQMLRSLKKRVTNTGFSIWFSSRIAKYHDNRRIARVVRKMLPDKGERFTRDIQTEIKKSFLFWMRRAFRK